MGIVEVANHANRLPNPSSPLTVITNLCVGRWLAPVAGRAPQQVVILQLLLQPLGQTALARSHTRCAGADCGDQCRHVDVLCLCDINLHTMPSQESAQADRAQISE